MSVPDRSWMYRRLLDDGTLNQEFVRGIEHFISCAIMHPEFMNGPDEVRCPCKRCANRAFRKLEDVKLHLCSKGFCPNYYLWEMHGEPYVSNTAAHVDDQLQFQNHYNNESMSPIRQMVFDAAGPDFANYVVEEEPNVEAKKFFDMLQACDEELWPGCEKHSVLPAIARLLNIKSENHRSERCFDTFIEFLKEALPTDNNLPNNFYETKKLIQGLSLPVEKIDCCLLGCMLFWEEDSELKFCKICGQARYKSRRGSEKQKPIPFKRMYYFPLSPRLKRLYASNATASHMRWHDKHQCEDGEMCHPCDSEAWRHFSDTHPLFSEEPHNVRLGMCTDGLQPFGQTLNFYWREFEKRCQWEEPMNALVKSVYPSIMKQEYRRMVYGLKNKECQQFMSEEVYESWARYWASAHAKKKSKQAVISRHGGTEDGPMSCHSAGSLSMRDHQQRLTPLLGRPVTAYELFVYTHTRNHDGVTWVDDRSRLIHERVTATRERMQEAADQVVDEQRVYYESVGGFNNSSRLYGLGDGSGFYASQPQTQDGVPFSTSSSILQIPQMTEQVTRMKRDMQSLIVDRQADQSRLEGAESRLESVIRLVRDLRSEMELLRMDIVSSNESHHGSPSP